MGAPGNPAAGEKATRHAPPCEPGKAALVVAHPGHELMVYHWVERHRPLYLCLTEGSGGSASPRLSSTTRLLQKIGARPGPLYGRYPDRQAYQLLLDKRVDAFVALALEVAGALIDAGVDCVAGDAAEGFNPVHDACRFVIDGAVARVRRLTGRALRNYDFVLDSRPDTCPAPLRAGATWLHLDDDALRRKFDAAMEYPEMRNEVELAAARFGKQAFALECLRPAATSWMIGQFANEAPAYEWYGRIRVQEGVYREVIRYREHVLPVLAAIKEACA
jgi:hypothetical protein